MYALVAAVVRKVLQIADHVHNFVVSVMNSYMQRSGVVVKTLRYKPAGRGFDSRLCHWNF